MSQEVPVEIVSIEQIEGGGGSIIINCNNGEVFSIEKPIDENLLYGLNYNIYHVIDNRTKNIINDNTLKKKILDMVLDFRAKSNVSLPVIESLAYIQVNSESTNNIGFWDCSKINRTDKDFSSVIIPHFNQKNGEVDHLSTIIIDWDQNKYYLFDTSGGGIHQSCHTNKPFKKEMYNVGVPEEKIDNVIALCIGNKSIQGRISCAYWTAAFNVVISEKNSISEIINGDKLNPEILANTVQMVEFMTKNAKCQTNFINKSGIEELFKKLNPEQNKMIYHTFNFLIFLISFLNKI